MFSIIFVMATASIVLAYTISKAQSWGLVDVPNERKFQTLPVPRLGGFSFYFSFILSSILFKFNWSIALLIGASVIYVGGLYDDLGKVHSAITKIYFQLIGCLIYSLFFPLSQSSVELAILTRTIVGLILFAMVNSFNLMDNLNGLTSGLSLIILMGIISLTKSEVNQISLIAFGVSIIPFFIINFSTGKVFMGDQGSQLLGFIIPAFFFEVTLSNATNFSQTNIIKLCLVLASLLLLFILDTLLVIYLRLKEGRSIFQGDQSHISHQLLKLGYSKEKVACILFLVQVGLIFIAVSIFNT